MTIQQQEMRSQLPPEKRNRQTRKKRWLLASILLLFIVIGSIIWVLSNRSTFTTIIPVVFFTVLSILIALFQWLFPVSSSDTEHPSAHLLSQNMPIHQHQVQPIIVHIPVHQSLSELASVPEKAPYRGIIGFPPPTNPKTIQQREQVVQAVYAQLTQTNITAIALTGIGGVGKSTLAALTYCHLEEQRAMHTTTFLAETLWLTIDSTVTFVDLAGNLFEALEKPLPDLSNLAPQNQALALFHALNTTDKPRLIILDQFENLLDWETGHALADRPGVGEWLDIINSQQCVCRILLTSRPRPVGTREYPPTYLREYPIKGLGSPEGVTLLRNRGVKGTEAELQATVARCEGHAFSLTLLISLICDHNISLTTLFKDPVLWIGNIAQNLLDYIYARQLNQVQRELLLAFSIYREPVSLEAATAIIPNASKIQVSHALKTLLTQHLVEPAGEGYYQLHAIITEYAQGHFDESNERANKEAQRTTHIRATQYYQQQAMTNSPPSDKRRKVSDVHDILEATWHYCQAEQWQEAYSFIKKEKIFSSLKRWGSNAILLEFCLLLQPRGNWSPEPSQAAFIHRYIAWAYNALGKEKQAQENHEIALKLYRESGDLEGQADILDALGWSYYTIGQMNQAKEYYEQILHICREIGKRSGEGHAFNGLGRVSIVQGKREQALGYFEQALAICKEVKDLSLKGRTLSNLGLVHTDLGNNAKALECLEQSLAIRKQVGDRRGESVTLNNLGRVYNERGQNERAVTYFEEALSICQTVGDRGLEGWTRNNLGWAYNALGQYEQAREFLEQALSIRIEVGDRRGESRTRRNLGLSLSMYGQKKQAFEYYKQAFIISQEIQDPYGEGTILYNIALMYFDQAQYDLALSYCLVAKRIFDEIHSPYSNDAQKWIDTIHKNIGEEPFIALLVKVEPQSQQIVNQTLLENV